MKPPLRRLLLASASPRRRELLAQLGVDAVVRPADIDETPFPAEPAADCVARLARSKAEAVWQSLSVEVQAKHAVLAADTVVVLDGQILGKPVDEQQAQAWLLALSDRWHTVMTAVTVLSSQGNDSCRVDSRVCFLPIDANLAQAYWATGEPLGKAGGYALQGLGASLVARLEGSPSAVIGLPLAETRLLLDRHGVATRLNAHTETGS